jgi:predicted phosphoribosyltransferase
MKNIIENPEFRNYEGVFADRRDAGDKLGQLVVKTAGPAGLLLAIPSGGVPVAVAMRNDLAWPLEMLVVRKVRIPWNTEAGFGALNLDGDRLFNEPLLRALDLSEEEMENQVQKTMATMERRDELFRGGGPFPEIAGNNVIIVDDGLASGYTMLAAIRFVKKRIPANLAVAVPTGLKETCRRIAAEVDRVYCLNIRDRTPFAVASAYRDWHDLTDNEVRELLDR